MIKNPHYGSSFDEFLKGEGIYTAIHERVAKEVLAMQMEAARKERKLSKNKMAAAMKTSRAALDRLLDPENTSVTLRSLIKAASVLGKRVQFTFADV